MLNFTEFQNANEERCVKGFNHKLDGWSLLEWSGAMAGEVGEACNKAKKLKRFDGNLKGNKLSDNQHDLKDAFAGEIADAIIYGFLCLSSAGYNAEEIIRDIFNRKSEEIGSDIKV